MTISLHLDDVEPELSCSAADQSLLVQWQALHKSAILLGKANARCSICLLKQNVQQPEQSMIPTDFRANSLT